MTAHPGGFDLAVWQSLQEFGRPVHSAELEEKLFINSRNLQHAVARLVDAGYPIGSSPSKGYYIIQSEIEWRAALRDLDSRVHELESRRNRLFAYGNKRGWQEIKQGELALSR